MFVHLLSFRNLLVSLVARERLLNCPPSAPYGLDVIPSLTVDKFNTMVHSPINVSFLLKGSIALPTVSDDFCSRKNVLLYQGDQCSSRPVLYSTIKHLFDPLSVPPNTHWPSTLLRPC